MARDHHPLSFPSLQSYGSTALVTGASSGIGACFARALAVSGFQTLILVARREERLNSLKDELERLYSCSCIPVAIDLSVPGACSRLAQIIDEKQIVVDLVVNNAGFGLLGCVETIDSERCRQMVDLNCGAVVDLTRVFLGGMKTRGRGAIIITSSVVGALPTPWFSVYAATKAFDLYFGEALYAECRGSGVDILTVLPGLTETEFQAGMGEREYSVSARTPEQVVSTACRSLGKKAIVVDGLLYKLLVHGSRFLPRCILLPLSRRIMQSQIGSVVT